MEDKKYRKKDKTLSHVIFVEFTSHVQDIKDIRGRQSGGGPMARANYKMEDKTVMQMRYVKCLLRASY